MVALGSGSGSMGSGLKFNVKATYRELRSSHERPVQDICHVKMRDAISRNIIDGGNLFSKRKFTPLDPSRKMRSEILLLLAC